MTGEGLAAVAEHLTCPTCGGALTPSGGALRCGARHTFDLARQGYVNLLAGGAPPGTADTAAMVAARHDFLATGHYRPLRDAVAHTAAELLGTGTLPGTAAVAPPGAPVVAPAAGSPGRLPTRSGSSGSDASPPLVLDAGAGTGHYLTAVLDRMAGAVGLALDISKYALRRAARAHPRAGAAVWDVWRPLPVRSGTVTLVLNVFAPRNGAEFHRVLRPDGALLVVTPTDRHLAELVGPLRLLGVDDRKAERLADTLTPHFRLTDRTEHTFPLRLTHPETTTLVRMGPSAHHLAADDLARRIAALPEPVPVTAAMTLSTYRPR